MRRALATLAAAVVAVPLAVGASAPPSEAAVGTGDCTATFLAVRPDSQLFEGDHFDNVLGFYGSRERSSLGFVPTALTLSAWTGDRTRYHRSGWAVTRGGALYHVRRTDTVLSSGDIVGTTQRTRVATGWDGTKAIVMTPRHVYRFSKSFVRRYTMTSTGGLTGGVTVAYSGYYSVKTAAFSDSNAYNDQMYLTTTEGRLEKLVVSHRAPAKETRTVARATGFAPFRAFSVGRCTSHPNAVFFLGVTKSDNVRAYHDPDGRDGLGALTGAQDSPYAMPYKAYSL